MPKTLLATLFALVATLSASCARDPAPTSEDAAASGVTALLEDWSRAGAEGRWSDLKALYADEPGFVWIEQGQVAYADHAAAVAGVDQVAAMGARIESEVSDIAVTPLSPDAAAFRAHTNLELTAPSFAFAFDGVISGVAVRRDERWVFLQGHLSAPMPAPEGEADAQSNAPR